MLLIGWVLVVGVDILVLMLIALMPFQVRTSSEGYITDLFSRRIHQITSMFFFASSLLDSTLAESRTS